MPELTVQAMYVLAGVILYAMFHHLAISRRGGNSRLHGLFGLVCFFDLVFAIVHAQTIRDLSISSYLLDLKLEITFALLLIYSLTGFIAYYTGQLARRLLLGLGAVYAFLIGANLLLPYSLQYDHFTGLGQAVLPWGEVITSPRGRNGLWTYLTVLVVALSFGYAFWRLLIDYRIRHEPAKLWMLLALTFAALGVVEGIMVRLGFFDGPEVGPLSLVGVIIIMSAIYLREWREQLRASENNFHSLFDNSPIAMAVIDPQTGRMLEANQVALDMSGYTREEFLGTTVLDFSEADSEEAIDYLLKRLSSDTTPSIHFEGKFRRRDGSPLLTDTYFSAIRDDKGKAAKLIASAVDVTEVRHTQQKIKQESEKNRVLLRNASDGLHIVNATGYVIEASDSFCAMLGYSRDEILGMHIAQWDDMMTGPEIRSRVAKMLEQNKHAVFETRHRRKDGSVIMVEVSSFPLELEGQRVLFNSSRDITDRKGAENALRESETRFHTLFAMAPVGISMSRDGVIVGANAAYKQMHGYGPEESLIGWKALELFAPSVRNEMRARIARRASGQETVSSYESVGYRKDGTEFPKLISATRVEMADGPITFAYSIDFSELKQRERELAQSRQVLIERNESLGLINQLAQRLHGSIVVEDILSEAISALLGMSYTPHVAIYLLDAEHAELRLAASHGFEEKLALAGKRLPLTGSLSGRALAVGTLLVCDNIATDDRLEPTVRTGLAKAGVRSGLVIPMLYEAQPIGTINLLYQDQREFGDMELETLKAFSNTVALAIANARNVQRLAYQAKHDSLTGLVKRSVLHDEFARQARSHEPGPIALILLDLNRFKEINDTLGHQIGDRLLKEVGPRLEESVHGRQALACRLGGDEFAILLTDLVKETDAADVAEEVGLAFKRPFLIDGMALQVGASIGVAYYPEHGSDSHALLRAADVAMYQAKSLAKGVMIYDRSFDSYSPERLAIASELAQAVEKRQLLLHYQPKADIATGDIVGFEALVRWQHPRLGLLHPWAFIHLVEMSEIIHPFTHAVMDQAMSDKRKLHDLGYRQPVAINLSARNLMDARCVSNLDQLLTRHALPQEEIELELTETALMHDPDSAVALLQEIAAKGVNIAIDDFGTGYSSLAYLRRLPLSALKIDRSFVLGMQDNTQDAIIVRSAIALAHNLGLKVIAEGVESAAALELLREMGCDQAQGYHLCEPLPPVALQSWLQARGMAAGG